MRFVGPQTSERSAFNVSSKAVATRLSKDGVPLVTAVVLLFPVLFLDAIALPETDLSTHLRWAVQFAQGLYEGTPYPRWAPDAHLGLGDPSFLYYQPLLYYLTAALNIAVDDIGLAIRLALWTSYAALGMIASRILYPHLSGGLLWISIIFIQALPLPFFMATHVWALPWISASPFLLLFAYLSARNTPSPALVAISLTLLVLTHLLSALMALIAVGAVLAIYAALHQGRNFQVFFSWAVGVGLGLLTSSFFLYPALTQHALISPEGWTNSATLEWERGFAFPIFTYLTHGFRWFSVQWPIPLMILTVAVLAFLGNALADVTTTHVETTWKLGLFSTAALVMSSELAYPLYKLIPSLQLLQQPYRFTVPAALFASVAATLAILGNQTTTIRWSILKLALILVIIVHLVLTLSFAAKSVNSGHSFPDTAQLMREEFGQPEYLPSSAQPGWRLYLKQGGWAGDCERQSIHCEVQKYTTSQWSGMVSTTQSIQLRLPIFDFPAWHVRVNGHSVVHSASANEGLIEIELPPGSHQILIYWSALPSERVAWMLSLAGLCGVALASIPRTRLAMATNNALIRQFTRFASAGAMGTTLHYGALIALVALLGLSPVIATTLGATLGALTNYWLNHRFTFRSTRRHTETLPRFMAMAAVGIVLNGFIVGTLADQGLHYLLAQIAATTIVLFTNYMVSRLWIFRPPTA